MKIVQIVLVFFLLMMTVFGCSSHKLNGAEEIYYNTADSLNLYKDLTHLRIQLDTNEMIQDMSNLTYHEFKNKYDFDGQEIELLSQSVLSTIEIAQVVQSIEENMMDIESLNLTEFDTTSNNLKFHIIDGTFFEDELDSTFDTIIIQE